MLRKGTLSEVVKAVGDSVGVVHSPQIRDNPQIGRCHLFAISALSRFIENPTNAGR